MNASQRTTNAMPISKMVKTYRDDYIGQKFGSLTVVAYPTNQYGIRRGGAYCMCDCGNEEFVGCIGELVKGYVDRCMGCRCEARRQAAIKRCAERPPVPRGKYYECNKERLYRVWCNMRERCKSEHGPYGDVEVCEEWQDYFVFREWALAAGYDKDAPYHECTLDRINPFGNYEPSNCRWADWDTQIHNKRRDWLKQHAGKEN